MADNLGGFECAFLEKTLSIVQSECPVCLLVLREPYQVNCCGYAFCRVCIEKIKAESKVCPCCKAEKFDKFEDKRLKRTIYAFKVHCTNKKQDCQWEGELGQLDNHLNYNPSEEKQLEGCQFSKINCLHCSELFFRSNIQVHQSDQCLRRPFSCEYCKEYDTYYEDVTINHWSICRCYPLECLNKCGQTLERQHLESHISKDCPLTVVDCDFQHVGCEVRLHRKDMPAHLVESVVCHLSLQTKQFKYVVARIEEEHKQQIARLKKENNELRNQVVKLTEELEVQKLYTTICPVEFTMTNFETLKEENAEWKSSPFFTHLKGYKLRLGVFPNGYNLHKGKWVSIYLVLMKGESDYQLEWPFTGNFEIQLLNQDEGHHAEIISFIRSNGNRVTKGEESSNKNRSSMFIRHDKLRPRYLPKSNDCLKFRILLHEQG